MNWNFVFRSYIAMNTGTVQQERPAGPSIHLESPATSVAGQKNNNSETGSK